jgi:hypothetical protein
MVKKSKPSGKAESKSSIKEEAVAVKAETVVTGEDRGKFDFFYLMNGAGVLIGIIYIIFIIFHYILNLV